MIWYRRRDSNPHSLVPKTSASYALGYAGMVDLARFERATSTFAESRSHSAELQVRRLAEATGVEPVHAMRGDLANRCHTIRRRLPKDWRKAKESNPRDAMLGLVFKTSCAPPRTAFRIGWDARI